MEVVGVGRIAVERGRGREGSLGVGLCQQLYSLTVQGHGIAGLGAERRADKVSKAMGCLWDMVGITVNDVGMWFDMYRQKYLWEDASECV